MLLAVLLLWGSAVPSAADSRVQDAVDAFAASARLPKESMAVVIAELPGGKVLGEYNADKALTPASIMKSVTLASVSDVEDPDDRIETVVSLGGKPDADGVVHGNMYIDAVGDPSLNSRVWPQSEDILSEITKALRREGIREIAGGVVIDESYLAGASTPDSWMPADLRASYGTGSHSFNYANNASGKSSVANPAGVFMSDLRRALAASGMKIGSAPVEDSGRKRVLVRHQSPELKEIMRSCMMRSDNMFAETMLRRFGKKRGGDGSTDDSAGRETKYYKKKGYDMDGVNIVDGSGLSRSNRMTARFMEEVLRGKKDDVEYVSYFPLAGQEGTLKRFLADTPLDSYIALKTGSMNGIQCYAGYKLDDDFAPTHVVVVIVNDFRCDRGHVRAQVEKMLLDSFAGEASNESNKTE